MSKLPSAKQQKEDSSFYTFFNQPIPTISDSIWKDIIDDQDYDSIILEVREEILANVTNICYKNYINCEVYKFLVQCTHEAAKQIVSLHYCVHDSRHKYSAEQLSWLPDAEPETCKPDSWAVGNILLNNDDVPKNKFQQTDTVLSEYQLIRCSEYPTTNVFETFSETVIEPEEEISEEQSPSLLDVASFKETEPSQLNVQFTAYNISFSKEFVPSMQDISTKQVVSENMFYKIMKMNKSSGISIQNSLLKSSPKKCPITWTAIDEIKGETKKLNPSPFRLNVNATVEVSKLHKKRRHSNQ